MPRSNVRPPITESTDASAAARTQAPRRYDLVVIGASAGGVEVLNLLLDLKAELGLTYMFISHDLNVVRFMSDRVMVMYLGKVAEVGPSDVILRSPRHPYTAALLASMPSLDPDHRTQEAPLAGDPPNPIDPPSGCRFHTRCKFAAPVCSARAPGLPYKTPYDALTMASIIEKETGKASDRSMVAGVFANRLRVGMPLQTDPTVIYGMGESYTGHLRKKDLQTDTPYNTYTRMGLPPSPIALPGVASLQAALNPAQTSALYFVSRGDGSSIFSDTLGDHNKAVDKYIRGQ